MTIIRNGRKGAPARHRASALSALVLTAFACAILAASVPAEAAQATVSVLCYHSFLDKKRMDPYCFTVEELNSQLMQLRKEGFRFVSVNDVLNGRITGAKNVLVTIDDGNRSVYDAYLKVLKPNGIRPLLAIYPNIIDKKKYALTWDQLTYLANNGCDIAAHGFFHLKINQKLLDTNPRYFRMEIFKSKEVLEEKLKRKVTIFIFPFGLRTDVAVAALKEAGYRYGFTIKRGRIDLPVASEGDRPFELPRYMVTRTTWNICFSRIMKNAGLSGAPSVAAAETRDRPPVIAVNDRPLVDRIDPITRLEEHLGERPAPVSMKLSASEPDRPDKQRPRKKKREERTALISGPHITAQHDGNTPKDKPRILTPEKIITVDHGDGITVASPIQRVTSGVHRDVLGLDARNAEVYDDLGPRSVMRKDTGTVNDRDGEPAEGIDGRVLKGKLERDASGYRADMKKRYRTIHDGSQKSYDGFLDMIKDKLGRVRTKIRQYVMKNF
jgi:peptidoglycan/xylan/chitin deacetylase (PgdA/CDA1 family)